MTHNPPKIGDYVSDRYRDEMAFLNKNCSPIGRAFLIEYVEHLTATPHVLRMMMGSPSQEHTIDNLAASLDRLLSMLRGEEE